MVSKSYFSCKYKTHHELDLVLNEFNEVTRSKDLTPLEYVTFYSNPIYINNKALEMIIDLFYLTRYARSEASKSDVIQFIQSLNELIVSDLNQNELIT